MASDCPTKEPKIKEFIVPILKQILYKYRVVPKLISTVLLSLKHIAIIRK